MVEAVFAPQRTAMEGRQRGHVHAVDSQPVTVDAYEGYSFHFECKGTNFLPFVKKDVSLQSKTDGKKAEILRCLARLKAWHIRQLGRL